MKCGKGISAGASRRDGNDRQVKGNVSRLRRSVIFGFRTQRLRAGLNSAAPTALEEEFS